MIVQSDLERLKAWLTTYDGADLLSKLRVDYTGNLPGEFGVFPGGHKQAADFVGSCHG